MPLGCEMISQPYAPPLRKFLQLWNTLLAHECHFTAPSIISQLQNALRNPQCLKNHIFAATPPFRSPPTPFCSYKMGCENAHWLQKCPLAAKSPFCCEMVSRLQNGLRKCPLAAKMAFGCEMILQPHSYPLRNPPLAAKSSPSFEMAVKWSPSFEMAAKSPPSYESKLQIIFKLRNHLQVAKPKFKLAKWTIQRVTHLAESTYALSDICNRLS